jgi:release factor glutamine methyltransferase
MGIKKQTIYQDSLALLQSHWAGLPDKPDETPETTLDALWRCAASSEPGGELGVEEEARLTALVEKRLEGEPLAYLTGKQFFMGIEFLSSPEAMIPRKETEILGMAALAIARELAQEKGDIKVMDLCSGSGNIALTLAYYEPHCTVVGADISPEAVQLARRNAEHLNLAGRSRFYAGDLFAPFEQDEFLGQMDLVTCNPPYISAAQVEKMPGEIANHEPRLAFDGGPFGVQVLARFMRESHRFLRPGGWICFEMGLGQGKAILNMLNKTDRFERIEALVDDASEVRAFKARSKQF